MINHKTISQFKDSLRADRLKFTPQRLSVLEEIISNESHRECEKIYLALTKRGSNVSRATVYRTMDILVKNGFARKIEFGDGRARYESKINSQHHDHLVCTSCGRIVEFLNQDIEDIQEQIAKDYHFKLQRHIHQLFGICKKCR